MLRDSPLKAIKAGGQTMDTVGWAAILPQMLAALGALFAMAGVGGVVADLVKNIIPSGLYRWQLWWPTPSGWHCLP